MTVTKDFQSINISLPGARTPILLAAPIHPWHRLSSSFRGNLNRTPLLLSNSSYLGTKMSDPHRSSSSYENPGPPQEFYDPQDYHPQGYHPRDYNPQAYHTQAYHTQAYHTQAGHTQADHTQADNLAPQQQSTHYQGMNPTSVPTFTGEPRHVVLRGQPPTVVASHIRGPRASAPQADQDLYGSNGALSYFADITLQQPRIPTGDSMHQEYQQHQPAWSAAPPAGSQPHQQIQTNWPFAPLREIDWWPHPIEIPGSHVPPGSSRVRPPAEQEDVKNIKWTDGMNEYVLQQGAKVMAAKQPYTERYTWDDFAEDFPREFPGINPAPTNLKSRFYRLRREAQEEYQEAREEENY